MLNEIKQDAQTRMAKSIDALKHTLTSIRTGRASPALLDRKLTSISLGLCQQVPPPLPLQSLTHSLLCPRPLVIPCART